MEWDKLLKVGRLGDKQYVQQKLRPTYAQDMDRILFSQPFRRLANKTQVHPLYDNDHIHHRLIHSLEVSSVGRSLGTEVAVWLADERHEIDKDQVEVIAGLVQTACMAHDIGNPPFGHSGEEAIASWFKQKFMNATGILKDISEAQQQEFESFEGNAQGFRILTRTEMYKNDGGLRLALGSLGSFTKYPVSAAAKLHVGDEGYINGTRYAGLKKYGFFENDIVTFEHVADELGLPRHSAKNSLGETIGHWWRRHPLSLLMEAADDICYNVMDLEDAFLSGDVAFDVVISLLGKFFAMPNKSYPEHGEEATVSLYRAKAINGAVNSCVQAFKDNYVAIIAGDFPVSLVDVSSVASEFKAVKEISTNRIFKAPRKTELEVYGRNVVYRVLDGLLPMLDELGSKKWDHKGLSDYHVQVVRALGFPIASLKTPYDALHALTDYVSGMTDRYAVKVANMIGR